MARMPRTSIDSCKPDACKLANACDGLPGSPDRGKKILMAMRPLTYSALKGGVVFCWCSWPFFCLATGNFVIVKFSRGCDVKVILNLGTKKTCLFSYWSIAAQASHRHMQKGTQKFENT